MPPPPAARGPPGGPPPAARGPPGGPPPGGRTPSSPPPAPAVKSNSALEEDKATLLKVFTAMGGDEQTLTNNSDDVSKWKGVRVGNGRVNKIGEWDVWV